MALPFDAVGTEYPVVVATIDPERALAYAAATNDDNPAYTTGTCAPPLFAVVPTSGLVFQICVDVIPPDSLLTLLHGEQDMRFHQPLRPGATLHTTAEVRSTRVGSTGTRLTLALTSTDDDGAPVVDQLLTLFLRGLTDGADLGPDLPPHALPDGARENILATYTMHYDADQTFRYRDVSGDPNPIHLDADLAKSVGLPGIIIHGLCTMAMCSQAVIRTQCASDPARLARLAARFTAPAFPGNDVTVSMYDLGPGLVGYEASSAGQTVLSNGLAEVR
jgi:acyl dehydratase